MKTCTLKCSLHHFPSEHDGYRPSLSWEHDHLVSVFASTLFAPVFVFLCGIPWLTLPGAWCTCLSTASCRTVLAELLAASGDAALVSLAQPPVTVHICSHLYLRSTFGARGPWTSGPGVSGWATRCHDSKPTISWLLVFLGMLAPELPAGQFWTAWFQMKRCTLCKPAAWPADPCFQNHASETMSNAGAACFPTKQLGHCELLVFQRRDSTSLPAWSAPAAARGPGRGREWWRVAAGTTPRIPGGCFRPWKMLKNPWCASGGIGVMTAWSVVQVQPGKEVPTHWWI